MCCDAVTRLGAERLLSMQIRTARQEEWPQLQSLNNEVFVDNVKYDPDLVHDWAYTEAGKKYYQNLVVDPKSICFVAEDDDGQLIGYLAAAAKTISYRKSRYLEIDNMGVLPQHRSRGIGRLLMKACQVWARVNGYQKLFVISYGKNEGAVHFYKKCGFGIIDIGLEMTVL